MRAHGLRAAERDAVVGGGEYNRDLSACAHVHGRAGEENSGSSSVVPRALVVTRHSLTGLARGWGSRTASRQFHATINRFKFTMARSAPKKAVVTPPPPPPPLYLLQKRWRGISVRRFIIPYRLEVIRVKEIRFGAVFRVQRLFRGWRVRKFVQTLWEKKSKRRFKREYVGERYRADKVPRDVAVKERLFNQYVGGRGLDDHRLRPTRGTTKKPPPHTCSPAHLLTCSGTCTRDSLRRPRGRQGWCRRAPRGGR